MGRAAHVRSIDAVRAFKQDLVEFQNALQRTLEIITGEVHRELQWLESDRSVYWPAQVRKASNALSEARVALEGCMLAASTDQRRSFYDEKKALERAQQRLAHSEQMVRTTKHWVRVAVREADEFQSRLARLQHMVEHDLPRGIVLLEKIARALEKYVDRGPGTTEPRDRQREPADDLPAITDGDDPADHRPAKKSGPTS